MEAIVLLIEGSDGSRRELSFTGYGEISLGRGRDNDVVLADRHVLPRHATLQLRDDGVYVCDVNDAGTFLEGRPISGEEPLLPGDRLTLGRSAVRLQSGEADSTRPRSALLRTEPETPNTMFGRYDLLELLGRGGMAEVYLAEDTTTHRLVALKRILPALLGDAAMLCMFHDEARLCALLDHPGICHVEEVGSVDGEPYLAMELVNGRDLRDLEEPLAGASLALQVSLLCEICAPLAYAHSFVSDGHLGVVHRNIVPANVMLDRQGALKLLDFGIARWRDRETVTEGNLLKGVLAYVAPELLRGDSYDHRVDLFALGVLLYDLCAGENPFARSSAFETLEALRSGDFPALRDLDPELPVELEQVADRLLASDPDDRFGDALQLREALHEAVPESRLVLPTDRAQLLDA